MEDDPGASEDERTEELSSIEAIYPELKIDPTKPHCATLDMPVAPERSLKIYFQAVADGTAAAPPTPPTSIEPDEDPKTALESTGTAHTDVHELSHLPSVTLEITLPKGYPALEPPHVELTATLQWLPKDVLEKLQADCTRLWEEIGKDQVVYTYIDHIQQLADNAFGVADNKQNRFELPGDLKLALLDYDMKCKREQFEKGTFDCGVCLEPKKGVSCHRMLLCGHVFCVGCLQDFYNNCITEGDVDNVKCLSPSCGKSEAGAAHKRRRRDRTLNPSELLQIPIAQDAVQRYVRLKRKKQLEADKNTIYCPRQWCQGAARSEKHPKPMDPFNDFDSESEDDAPPVNIKKNTEDTPMSDRLCICEDCNFAFCWVCKKGWHGELGRCNPRSQLEINEEEKASLEYMQKFSTACPTCNARSQKTYGCNHMICFKCKTHFCYLCSAWLLPDNPYRHFNDKNNECYMKLWELEGGHGAEAGGEFVAEEPRLDEWEPEEDDDDTDGEDILFNLAGPVNIAVEEVDEADESDEEPAPDQRRPARNMHIEIVNFAGNGAGRRIELPDRARAAAPPPVPDPPARRGRGQQGNRQRAMRQEPHRRQPIVVRVPAEVERQNLPAAAPGQGNAQQLPGPMRAMGLERFLELAQQDQEDEWDSDELEEDDDPIPRLAGRRDVRR